MMNAKVHALDTTTLENMQQQQDYGCSFKISLSYCSSTHFRVIGDLRTTSEQSDMINFDNCHGEGKLANAEHTQPN